MIQLLSLLTTIVNLVGLAVSLCLGFYIVTRSPRNRLSWLAALTLWSLTCFFLHNALMVNLPDLGVRPWLRPVVVLALPLWFHLTLLLSVERTRRRLWFYLLLRRLPRRTRRRLRPLALAISRFGVPLAYALALALVVGGAFPLGLPSEVSSDPALFLADREVGLLYPLSIAFLIVLGSLALLNMQQARQQRTTRAQRRQFTHLIRATSLGGLGALYLGLGVWLQLDVPALPGDLAMGVAVGILGYNVAKYNALVEGRTIERELLYISLAIGSLTVFNVVVAEILYLGGHVFSLLTLVIIIVAAISSLMLYDGLRTTLDRLFYREQFQQLRANLRALAREAGTGQTMPERLRLLLRELCHTLRITKGFIALRQEEAFVCQATKEATAVGQTIPLPELTATEITDRSPSDAPGLEDMALLVPLCVGDVQIGALVLGSKESGRSYSEEDLILLDDVADQLAAVIQASQRQEDNARIINKMVMDFRDRERALQHQVQQMLTEREERAPPLLEGIAEKDFVSWVEDALRRLHDFPYLGEHALAQLQVVNWHLQGREEAFLTHIDRGKALSEVLLQALHKLRPKGAEPKPHTVPPREWHQFITLHDSYVLGELNRNIMSKLYISEGTFHRTRRRAVRGVAKALQEMEQQAQQGEAL